jgi:uncharacterized ParB-like nuclease family protein
MELGKVFIDSVVIGQRHRSLEADRVEALAESMNELGLQQPISVFVDTEDSVHLITGLHRLEAGRKLGWEQIEASFVKLSPTKREMWEIAENLFRVDLTKDQRDDHIRRYAELLHRAETELLQSAQNVAIESKRSDGRGHRPKGIVAKIADETGLSKKTVQRALNPTPPKVAKLAPEPDNDFQAHERQVAAIMSAWNRASPEARQDFLARIDTPVFDRSAA